MTAPDLATPAPGLRVRRIDGAAVIAVRLWLRAGARYELKPGQALVTGRALAEGTHSRDWRRIAAEAEGRGMVLQSFGAFEGIGVSVDALAEDWELALEWAAELLLEPAFPADRCEWLAKQAAAELESLADQPDIKTGWEFLAQLYAPHPRCRPLLGTFDSLAALRPEDCAEFHARAQRHGVLGAVAGVIDEEAVGRKLASLLARAAPAVDRLPEPPAPAGAAYRATIETGAEDQAHLFLGHCTVPRRHPDYAALELAAVVLGSGAGLTGRIPSRIREREGLAYTAYAQTVAGAGIDPGRLVAYVGTAPSTVEQAERGVREELERFVAEGVTAAELEEARAYLLGREPFQRETARQWADLLIEAVQYDLPLDDPEHRGAELRAVDGERLEAAARAHLRPAELRATVGLPAPGSAPSEEGADDGGVIEE